MIYSNPKYLISPSLTACDGLPLHCLKKNQTRKKTQAAPNSLQVNALGTKSSKASKYCWETALCNLGFLVLPIGYVTLNTYPVTKPKIKLKVTSTLKNPTVRKGN